MRKKIKKTSFIVMLCIFLLLSPTTKGKALAANGMGSAEGVLNGDIVHWENYYLDIEECDMFELNYSFMNGIANVLFFIVKALGFFTCGIFYSAIDLDLSALLSSEINGIQSLIKTNVFDALLILALTGTAISVLKRFMKKDLIGMAEQFGKSLIIIVLATLMTLNSDKVLSICNNVTKEASIRLLAGMNGQDVQNRQEYASDAVNILWNNLVHEPWKALEFGTTNVEEDLAKAFIEISPSNPGRESLVETHKTYFPKTKGIDRIGMIIVFLTPFMAKCVLYIAVAVIQLVFQALGIFFFLLGLLVLLLALLPGYEMDFVWVWVKKILETQLNILIVTMLMGFMIKVDNLLFAAAGSSILGWVGMTILQMAVLVGIYLGRNQIINAFSNMQKSIKDPRRIERSLQKSGNIVEGTRKARQKIQQVGNNCEVQAIGKGFDAAIHLARTIREEGYVEKQQGNIAETTKGQPIRIVKEKEEKTEKTKVKNNASKLVKQTSLDEKREGGEKPRIMPKQAQASVGIKQNNEVVEYIKAQRQPKRLSSENKEEVLKKETVNEARGLKLESTSYKTELSNNDRKSQPVKKPSNNNAVLRVEGKNKVGTLPKKRIETKRLQPEIAKKANEHVDNRTRKTAGR